MEYLKRIWSGIIGLTGPTYFQFHRRKLEEKKKSNMTEKQWEAWLLTEFQY